MKKLAINLIGCLVCLTFIGSNQAFKITQDEPDLQETVTWMESKVSNVRAPNDKYSDLHWNHSSKTFEYTYSIVDKNMEKFDPKNINPKSITYEIKKDPNAECYYAIIKFKCNRNARSCVKRFEENNSGKMEKHWFPTVSSGSITLWKPYAEENLVSRFIKAFKHLIKLRGGEGETF